MRCVDYMPFSGDFSFMVSYLSGLLYFLISSDCLYLKSFPFSNVTVEDSTSCKGHRMRSATADNELKII